MDSQTCRVDMEPNNDMNCNEKTFLTKIDEETDTSNQETNEHSPSGGFSRQVSTQSNGSGKGITFCTKRGSVRNFAVTNYHSTDINDCPPTPCAVSPDVKINFPSPSFKIKTEENLLEEKSGINVPEMIPKKRVEFLRQDGKLDTISENSSLTKRFPVMDLKKWGQLFAKRKQKRLVQKHGEVNVQSLNVDQRTWSYFLDMFTTLLDLKWRYIVTIFIMAFLATWLLFGLFWWSFVAYTQSGKKESSNRSDPVVTSCLDGVDDFSTALLFSIETQQTIGYGTRSVTPDCPVAIALVMLQSLVGVLLSCVMTGLIFAKFSRPKQRAETILFSKRAVICERDGERVLMFRVGDMRRTHMVSVAIRALYISEYRSQENEEIKFYQHNINVETESKDFFFLAWPIKIIHKIDETSPLWKMSAEELIPAEFEIVVVFEGTNQTTGQTTQIRTSYLPTEILWGHRLHSLLTSLNHRNKYSVDYTRFNDTELLTNMKNYSAEEFHKAKNNQRNIEKRFGLH